MRAGMALLAAGFLASCASVETDTNFAAAAELAGTASGVQPRAIRTEAERGDARRQAQALLAEPLTMDGAVRIAVGHGAALQAQLFENAARSAAATRTALPPNPVLSFERLLRDEGGDVEKEIDRSLSFSVVQLLTLPARLKANESQQQQLRLRAAGDIVQAAAEARQAWVRAVAARQAEAYAAQVLGAAEASAELARRMQSVGNFSKLQRAREQAFQADAAAQLARARQAALAAREALVRTLGLDAELAAQLRLPQRLPELPARPGDEAALIKTALEERIDMRMARSELDAVARQYGLARATSFVDGLEIALVHNSESGKPPQKGFGVELPLPIFDFGGARRAEAEAAYLAALNRAALVGSHAASQLREAYSAYRTAYDLARHYRDEVVPLRKAISDEMLLKYNGMLIGVFELLADARDQVASVSQALEAQRDFWLADAALHAAIVGRPLGGVAMEIRAPAPTPGGGGH